MKWYKLTIASLALIVIALILLLWKNNKTAISNLKASNSKLEVYKLKNGQLVSSQKTLVLDNKQLKEQLKSESETVKQLTDKFSTVKTITKIKETVRIDTITIVYTDSVPCVFEKIGSVHEPEYSLAYRSNQHGVDIYEMSIPDSVIIVTGTKRKWFLGRETKTFDITHSNKYIMTDEVQHTEVTEKKGFWETTVFKVLVGIGLGHFIFK